MSYSISLSVKDGAVTVVAVSGTPPEASISVSGHDDATTSGVSVSVSRRAVTA